MSEFILPLPSWISQFSPEDRNRALVLVLPGFDEPIGYLETLQAKPNVLDAAGGCQAFEGAALAVGRAQHPPPDARMRSRH